MKKMIAVLLFLALLSGCGSPAASPAGSSSGAGASSGVADKASGKLITEDEVKALLVGQQFPCQYRYLLKGEVREISHMQDSDLMYTIQDVTEISYAAETYKDEIANKTSIQISGTLSALGTMWENNGKETEKSKATAAPVNFTLSVNPEKTAVSSFDTEKIILVKPADPVDMENLYQYLDKDEKCEYFEPNPNFRADGKKDNITGLYIEPEFFVKKIDLNTTPLRILVTSEPATDPTIMSQYVDVDAYDGEKYLGSGIISIMQSHETWVSIAGDLKPKE